MTPRRSVPLGSILAVAFFLLLALALFGGAVVVPRAAALGLPWDPATLRQPNELKHRLRAILSSFEPQPAHIDDMQPIANTGLPPLGVNTFFEQEVDETAIRRSMEMIRAAGCQWIRQQFAWYEIEAPGKGQYVDSATSGASWAKYDRIVNLAAEYGLKVLARIDTVPAWARPEGSTFTHPPSNLQDYGDFVRTLVARYRGKVGYYQIWNEPNLSFEWGNQNVSASDFVPLLQVGYSAVKAADPQAVVIAAALAPTIDRGPVNRNDTLFLEEMYAAGAAGYFDVMSTMAYGLLSGPDDRRVDAFWQVNFSRSLLLRQIMVAHGEGNKPIWFSEVAWNALPDSFTGQPLYGRVTEDQQARYTVRGLQRMADEWPWAGVSFMWFFRRVNDSEKDQQWYYFRLVEPDFTPLPVYNAIKVAAPQMRVLRRGWHTSAHWAIDAEGRALSFTFAGADLDIVASGPGRLYVDAPGVRLPRDAQGRAYIDVPAAATRLEIVHGLSDGRHPAVLAMGDGKVAIASIIVDRRQGFPVALLWAAGGFVALWGLAWRLRR